MCMQEVTWEHFCDLALQESRFAGPTTPPAASALKQYMKAKSYRGLYALLQPRAAGPVGLWFRFDDVWSPRGSLLCFTATGNGQWSLLPTTAYGEALESTPVAVTNWLQSGCAFGLSQQLQLRHGVLSFGACASASAGSHRQ